ncbi:MAG: winged helix-turn-helix domain-containing protein [Gammaproteobacteria bacterium]
MEEKTPFENNNLYVFGPFRLNAIERRLTRDGKAVPLARKTFDLLLILIAAAGHLKTREELIEALWPDTIVEEQGLTTKMYALRKALGDDGEAPSYIETVRGVGYRFIAPTSPGTTRVAIPVSEAPAGGNDEPHSDAPTFGGRRLVIASAALALAVATSVLLWLLVPWRAAAPTIGASSPSIAVLPFKNLSTDKANAYFADGIRDTILTRLAELGDLRVVSRSASDVYANHLENPSRIGRELGVKTILEGSVQKAGDHVLINVQLINARTDVHIWAASYARTLSDIFKVESEVASRVAAALETRLPASKLAKLTQPPTRDPQAYVLYLKANYNARRAFDTANARDPATAAAHAASLYRKAIAHDPKFALAWARLSLLDSKAYWFELDHTPQRITAARKAAEHAITLAPNRAEAHVALGYADYYGAEDYAAALRQFGRARQIRPRDANVIGAIAYVHRRQGKWRAALASLRKAAALDPRNPRWHDEAGITLTALRRYPEAAQQFDQALAIAPDDYDARVRKIDMLLVSGDLKQARRELATMPQGMDVQGLVTPLRFEAAWLARKPDVALAVLDSAASHWKPNQPLRADAWALEDNKSQARLYYEKSRTALREKLKKQPDNPDLWSALGLAEAGLGNANATAAIEAGRHATRLYPVSKDRLAGPLYVLALAKIYARLGKPAPATQLLGELMSMPAGRDISVPLLRLDPIWDAIRHDPGFQSLLKKYGLHTQVHAPTAASAGAGAT